MNYRIIALDPGGTTGWATYSADTIYSHEEITVFGAPGPEYYGETWSCGQIGPEDHHLKLYEWLGIQQVQDYTVVCESFEFRNLDKRDRDNINLMSREYIGVIRLFCQERNVPLRMQTAAMGKGFIPDDKIKRAGLWHPNQKHAMDATRHLLYYLVNRENRTDLVRRWWAPQSSTP